MPIRPTRVFACALCALVTALAALAAPGEGVTIQPPAGPQQDLQQEMKDLFRRVETKLRDIDVLLTDAGAGDPRRLSEAGEAGLDELLRRSVEQGREVQREIDQLLRLAQQAGQQGGSGSTSSQRQQGQGQGEQQQGQEPGAPQQGSGGQSRNQEATPSLPEQTGPEDGGQDPSRPDGQQPGGEENGEQPGGQEPQPGGEGDRPDDGPESPDDDPRNQEGAPPDPDETDAPASRGDLSERWGELPVHVRDVFRTEGGEDMPAEYRDWIDAYYRKLNERASRSR